MTDTGHGGRPSCGLLADFRWLVTQEMKVYRMKWDPGVIKHYESSRSARSLVIRGISDFSDERKSQLDDQEQVFGTGDVQCTGCLVFLISIFPTKTTTLPCSQVHRNEAGIDIQ
jgi:hypothetical protein